MENVPGMLKKANSKRYLQDVVGELIKLGYQVRAMLLNAFDYGDPQRRKRVFLLAAKKGFPLPQVPTPVSQEERVVVDETLGDLETVDPVSGNNNPVNVNGSLVYDHRIDPYPPREYEVKCLKRGEPSRTVRRTNGMLHYEHNRDLTVRERARLQSFPDDYHFSGTPKDQSDQIGNAVPVNLAAAVGRSIIESYK